MRHSALTSLRYAPRRKARILRARTYATTTSVQDYDIVIVGGGPAGLALANALTSSQAVCNSLRISLIEASDLSRVSAWKQPDGSFSNRVSSITNESRAFLTNTGAWKFVEENRTAPIEEMQIWDGVSDARITFSAHASSNFLPGLPGPRTFEMARLTENLNLQRALLRSLADRPVTILDNTKVSAIERDDSAHGSWPLVHTSNGSVIRARLLIGADGHNSPVRTHAGIDSYGWSYATRAVVATLFHAPRIEGLQAPNTTAYQRFLPTGPIAFLPLSPTASSLVWSTKPALATALTSAESDVLALMVNAAFRLPEVSVRYLHSRLLEGPVSASTIVEEIKFRESAHQIDEHSVLSSTGAISQGVPAADAESYPPIVHSIQPNSVASFPLRFSHADEYIGQGERGNRTVLVGDAAHTVHPLAGQGLNMGLADAEALAKCIHNAVSVGGDIGSYTSLLPYARSRYFENHKMLSATDKLHKLYSSTLPPVVWARSVGVEVLNELDMVKAAVMMNAGAHVSQTGSERPDASMWSMAASGFEFASGVNSAAKTIGGALGSLVSSKLNEVLSTYSRR